MSSLVLTITVYTTTFGSTGSDPVGLPYLFAIDWLLDRLRTLVSVTGDLLIAAIVANKIKSDIEAKDGDFVERGRAEALSQT